MGGHHNKPHRGLGFQCMALVAAESRRRVISLPFIEPRVLKKELDSLAKPVFAGPEAERRAG